MVKVVEKTLDEKALEDRQKMLVGLTKDVLGAESVCIETVIGFNVNSGIFVSAFKDIVSVYEEKYFDTAMKIAEAYEVVTGKEFTVKKNY
ncbi:MAG: hypothetical protein AABX39_01200 [Nanoarchaeota archaeon]